MVTQQLLSKVIVEKNTSILDNNGLSVDFFPEYEEEYNYIRAHIEQFGNVPDEATFLAKFPQFTVLDVQESDHYLIQTIEEEHLYATAVPVIQKCADLMQTDSRDAVEYLKSQLATLQTKSFAAGTDLISQASLRFDEWRKTASEDGSKFIKSSFDALDAVTGGWRRGEELVLIFSRSGQGKTFVILEILNSAWKQGNVVGLIEPEMSPSSIGYRFDTLNAHISNSALYRGYGADAYEGYIEELKKNEVPFWVATPRDFGKQVTVPKLKSWCIANGIQVLAIDGASYLQDVRAKPHDNRTTELTHIAEDLMYDLSQELGIPVFLVHQANRTGVGPEAPSLESVRDSDGMAFNASIVISLRKYREEEDQILTFSIEKNRHGPANDKVSYTVDLDHGIFVERPAGETFEAPPVVPVRKPTASTGGQVQRGETF